MTTNDFYYDPCSFANPGFFLTTHIDFDWKIDFSKKTISGTVDISLKKNLSDHSNQDTIILDTRDLNIEEVTEVTTNTNLLFELGNEHKAFGKGLHIAIKNLKEKDSLVLRVKYETSPCCSALQWLGANMTIGKKYPYLFSQCQAIHARSLFPCQDTPSVKFTYKAKVAAERHFVVLMSAVRDENPETLSDELVQYKFTQNITVPSYLLAIAAGDLASKRIGPRSHVWTEREILDDCAYEFAETEEMLTTAESIAGPYVWGVYDLLVLPPTFPYGGMENPCLTFVTPTLLAGDRSLADVVIHEISHSWTGNLVTNRNWEHFWLNEGFTMFLERKIIARMKKSELPREFDCIEGWRKIQEAVSDFGETNQLTKLVPNLTDVDPDDSFSSIPYEKGHALLYYLEKQLGGVEIFDKYLRAHVENFKGKSFDTNDWKAFLYSFFPDKHDILDAVDWKGWLDTAGMPPVVLSFDKTLAEQCSTLCDKILKNDVTEVDEIYKSFNGHQVIELLSELLDSPALPITKIESLDKVYKFGSSRNAEVLFRWLRIGIKAQWEPIIPPALKFVSDQGRMKYTRPVYRDLYKWEGARQRAIDNFIQQRPFMHQTTASLVAKDLHLA